MKTLCFSARGSVSVFLMMIFASIFTFMAVFIDYARIAAVQMHTEQLAKASMRSVMSAFDPELHEKYGLFAFGESDGNEMMASLLRDSLHMQSGRGAAFHLLDTRLDTQSVAFSRELGQYAIFERQILEEMKYKAPIDFTLEVVNRFKPMSAAMKEASNTTDLLARLGKLFDKREALIDEIVNEMKEAGKKARQVAGYIAGSGGLDLSDRTIGSISTAADIAAQYADYAYKRSYDANLDEDEPKRYVWETALYEYEASQLTGQMTRAAGQAENRHRQMADKLPAKFDRIRELNDEMKQVIAAADSNPNNAKYEKVEDSDTPPAGIPAVPADISETVKRIRSSAEELILPDSFFDEFRSETERQSALFASVATAVDRFQSHAADALSDFIGNAGAGSLKQSVREMKKEFDKYASDYDPDSGRTIVARTAEIERHRSSERERKNLENKGKQQLKQAKNLIDNIAKLKDRAKAQMENYNRLEQYYDANRAFNEQSGGEEAKQVGVSQDPGDAGKESMSMMDGLFGGMSDMLAELRDEFYRNEYAVHQFRSFDPAKLKHLFASSQPDDALINTLGVNNQELEYILYGFHNPGGNLAAAYGEIFGMRLAIRTMEGLAENARMGHPLLVLAAALLYGIEHAIADLLELVNKGSLTLSKYVPIKLTYKDHMRMFLMLHTDNGKTMSRMLALIQFNTGANPAEKPTYVRGEVRTSIRLWFMPGMMRMLGYVGLLHGEVENNRYYATKKAAFSY